MSVIHSITMAMKTAFKADLSHFNQTTQNVANKLANHYGINQHDEQSLKAIEDFIKILDQNLKATENEIFEALIHAYTVKNHQYPDNFDMYIATQYLAKKDKKMELPQGQDIQWFKQKITDAEKHLERIALVKLQLTKNLKELLSQGNGHFWIDRDFIEPAQETLQASLAQVQDIENRMIVLKATYQDHI